MQEIIFTFCQPSEQLMLMAKQLQYVCFFGLLRLRLTHPHADARSTKGDDAGDLERPAALWAHQTVLCPQTALGTTAP